MGVKKSITIDGRTFAQLQDAAQFYGVNKTTAARRLRSGWTSEQAFGLDSPPARRAHNRHKVYSKVGEFYSIREAAAQFGLDERTVAARLKLGWTIDEALEIDERPVRNTLRTYESIQYNGKTYESVASLARAHELAPALVRKRLKQFGWSIAQAVEDEAPPPRFRDHHGHARDHAWKKPTIVDGQLVADSIDGIYRLYLIRNKINHKEYVGITTNDLSARLRGHRRQAKLGTKGKLYNAMRRYGSGQFEISLIRDDAKDFAELQYQEISEIEVRETLKKGYNTALGGGLGTSTAIEVDGKVFPSRQSAALFYGIEPAKFNLRVGRLGWSPEEAAEIAPRRKHANHEIVVAGKSFPTLAEASRAYGLDYKIVHARVRRGWSYERALGLVG